MSAVGSRTIPTSQGALARETKGKGSSRFGLGVEIATSTVSITGASGSKSSGTAMDASIASWSWAIVSGSNPQPEQTVAANNGNTHFVDLNLVCFPPQDSNHCLRRIPRSQSRQGPIGVRNDRIVWMISPEIATKGLRLIQWHSIGCSNHSLNYK